MHSWNRSNLTPASRGDILTEACNEIEGALTGDLTPELVHLAVDEIYPYMGKLGMEKRISLLRKYMDGRTRWDGAFLVA